jgi:hypothetical protein
VSGAYVSRVLESGLAADLKFTAVVFASFADDHGVCWPAIGRVAYLRGLEERRVQYHVKELRRMEIFEIVRQATKWQPTYYRLQLEKLPPRVPYKPPERQRWLLGPPGAEPGVHSAAPLPGVHSTAPGVQPSAPDPSVRSVSTHTCTTRAREADTSAEVQPAAPLSEPGLPLLVAPRRDPDHRADAWCGRICVPKFLHKAFKKALGGPVTKRATRMRTFYAETLAAIPADQPIGDEPLKFWRTAFAARYGSAAPVVVTAREIEDARLLRHRMHFDQCPHTPQCTTNGECLREIALYRKLG